MQLCSIAWPGASHACTIRSSEVGRCMGGGYLEEAGGARGEGERAEEEEVAVDERLQRQVREVLEQQVDPKQRHRRRDGRQEALHLAASASSLLA